MVSTEDEEVFRVFDLVRQQQADGLERLLASVDVISKEQVVRFGRETTVLEETEEVVVLTVNVTADLLSRSSQQSLPIKRKKGNLVAHLDRRLQL